MAKQEIKANPERKNVFSGISLYEMSRKLHNLLFGNRQPKRVLKQKTKTTIFVWAMLALPLLYFNNMPTLSLGLYAFQQEIQYAANYPAYFAGALIAMLPILLIFIFFADKLMGQMYSGGLKG